MEAWPETLPQHLLRDGFDEQLANNVIATRTDSGAIMSRRVSTSGEDTLTGTMKMTTEQWNTLVTFFRDTVGECEPFEFPQPDDPEETIIVKFSPDSPPKRSQKKGQLWTVSLSFKVTG